MSNVVDLRHIVIEQLNSLPPHSRKREGMVAILRHLNTKEMREEVARMREADPFTVMLADALSEALAEGV